MAPSQGERLASLETRVDRTEQDIDSLHGAIKRLTNEIHSLVILLSKTKGLVTGVFFATSALWTVLLAGWKLLVG
ncbi:hypothetical protein FLL45_01495 [Aliikangiella marina]|uniref:Uncharacterized protein n=1 Tax=Aliikangiella marina TaxID=1712262 RepID=A0A545THN1_9GAMM|nr:hypothetical protein [Aliikangiella marina]TQV76661.1 hypothetical protein FLL45_01495 [Aliikangiella marina]